MNFSPKKGSPQKAGLVSMFERNKIQQQAVSFNQDIEKNFKSPIYLKLENMMENIQKYQEDFQGSRVPVYERRFIQERIRRNQQQRYPGHISSNVSVGSNRTKSSQKGRRRQVERQNSINFNEINQSPQQKSYQQLNSASHSSPPNKPQRRGSLFKFPGANQDLNLLALSSPQHSASQLNLSQQPSASPAKQKELGLQAIIEEAQKSSSHKPTQLTSSTPKRQARQESGVYDLISRKNPAGSLFSENGLYHRMKVHQQKIKSLHAKKQQQIDVRSRILAEKKTGRISSHRSQSRSKSPPSKMLSANRTQKFLEGTLSSVNLSQHEIPQNQSVVYNGSNTEGDDINSQLNRQTAHFKSNRFSSKERNADSRGFLDVKPDYINSKSNAVLPPSQFRTGVESVVSKGSANMNEPYMNIIQRMNSIQSGQRSIEQDGHPTKSYTGKASGTSNIRTSTQKSSRSYKKSSKLLRMVNTGDQTTGSLPRAVPPSKPCKNPYCSSHREKQVQKEEVQQRESKQSKFIKPHARSKLKRNVGILSQSSKNDLTLLSAPSTNAPEFQPTQSSHGGYTNTRNQLLDKRAQNVNLSYSNFSKPQIDMTDFKSNVLKNIGSEGGMDGNPQNYPDYTLNTDEAETSQQNISTAKVLRQVEQNLTPDQLLNIQENAHKGRSLKIPHKGLKGSDAKYWSFVNRRQQQQAIYKQDLKSKLRANSSLESKKKKLSPLRDKSKQDASLFQIEAPTSGQANQLQDSVESNEFVKIHQYNDSVEQSLSQAQQLCMDQTRTIQSERYKRAMQKEGMSITQNFQFQKNSDLNFSQFNAPALSGTEQISSSDYKDLETNAKPLQGTRSRFRKQAKDLTRSTLPELNTTMTRGLDDRNFQARQPLSRGGMSPHTLKGGGDIFNQSQSSPFTHQQYDKTHTGFYLGVSRDIIPSQPAPPELKETDPLSVSSQKFKAYKSIVKQLKQFDKINFKSVAGKKFARRRISPTVPQSIVCSTEFKTSSSKRESYGPETGVPLLSSGLQQSQTMTRIPKIVNPYKISGSSYPASTSNRQIRCKKKEDMPPSLDGEVVQVLNLPGV